MYTAFQKVKVFVRGHKVISIIIVLCIVGGVYYEFKGAKPAQTQYVLAKVATGTIVESTTGSGQVAASSEIDIKPQVSGTITAVNVSSGDQVTQGQTLFIIDPTDAEKAVRDAKLNLQTAQLNLQKLQEAPTDLSVLQIQDAISQAKAAEASEAQTVQTAYTTYLNSSMVALPNDLTNTQTPPTISGSYLGTQEGQITITVYQTGSGAYFSASGITNATGSVSTTIPQAIGDSGLYIKFASTGLQPSWIITIPNTTAANYLSNYTQYQSSLQQQQTLDAQYDQTIAENTEKLKELQAGADPIDLQNAQLAITQAQNTLNDDEDNLADYYVTAPFSGTIASVSAIVGDTASSGTAMGTIITDQQVANISLNEVDVAKIQLGDKATLTFDAVDGLTLTGIVSEIDTLGTVSQGVVTYNVTITFDTGDPRVKAGMSVDTAIITNVAQDVLVVPNSAIKTSAQGSYVQMFVPPLTQSAATATTGIISAVPPTNVLVQTGITDGTSTQITGGLKVGDQIVTRTIAVTAATTSSSSTAPSLFGSSGVRIGGGFGGGGGGGGGAARPTTTTTVAH